MTTRLKKLIDGCSNHKARLAYHYKMAQGHPTRQTAISEGNYAGYLAGLQDAVAIMSGERPSQYFNEADDFKVTES